MKSAFLKKVLAFILITTLFVEAVPSLVYAADNDQYMHDDMVPYDNIDLPDDLLVEYYEEDNSIIEDSSFTDSDGIFVLLHKVIRKDGTGELIITKNNKQEIVQLENQNYDTYEKNLPIKKRRPLRSPDVGKDIKGSQFKHVYISTTKATYVFPSNMGVLTVSKIVAVLSKSISAEGVILIWLAEWMYNRSLDVSPAKMEVTQLSYEVLFSYDNNYYTHCYHETVKSYDSGNHLIDTYKAYKQANGGM